MGRPASRHHRSLAEPTRLPGIKWVSYFNGGDGLHAFNRGSLGTPQNLGCVELPEASAARVYPYTPIGTLVAIED